MLHSDSGLSHANPWLNLELLKEETFSEEEVEEENSNNNNQYDSFDVKNDEHSNNNTIHLATKDIFPALHFPKESLQNLIKNIFAQTQDNHGLSHTTNIDLSASLSVGDDIISSSLLPIYTALGAPHTLSVGKTNAKNLGQRSFDLIPFTVAVHMSMSQQQFEDSSNAFTDRLMMALKSSRRFSLRSLMGIRAVVSVQRYQYHQALQLRFEIASPDLQFSFSSVPQPNILASRLSEHLVGLRVAPETAHNESSLRFGYLCYTSTRKVACVLESNPNLQSVTVQGVWVRIDEDGTTDNAGSDTERNLLSHPLCWGACARFVCSDRINIRRPECPFLLLVFNSARGTLRSFEVKVTNELPVDGGASPSIAQAFYSVPMSFQYRGELLFCFC